MRGAREQEAFIEAFSQWLRLDGKRVLQPEKPLGMASAKEIKACVLIWWCPFLIPFLGKQKRNEYNNKRSTCLGM